MMTKVYQCGLSKPIPVGESTSRGFGLPVLEHAATSNDSPTTTPETSALYLCMVPDLNDAVHSLKVDMHWVRPFIIATTSMGGSLERAQICLQEASQVSFVKMISDSLGYVGFGSKAAALEVEEDLSNFPIQFLSQDHWKHALRQYYLEHDSIAQAIASSKAELAEVQNRLLEAKGEDREILVYHQAEMERGLQDLNRAHDSFVAPPETQAEALHAMLENPLPTLLRQSIESAACLYDTGDPIMCDPNRSFTFLFLNGNIIGGSYNWPDFDAAEIELEGGSLWLEEGFVTPQSLVDRGNADLANAPASKIDIGS